MKFSRKCATTLLVSTIFFPLSVTYAAISEQMPQKASALEKVSYTLGHQLSSTLPEDLDAQAFIIGLRAGLAKESPLYNDEEISAASQAVQQQNEKNQQATQQKIAASEKEFFTSNAKKPGVITTASGLQYKITRQGKGKRPTANAIVTVHYTGKLTNGKIFDRSMDRGKPVELPLDQVIPGWTEGLQLLNEGSKATLYIPSKLGYGAQELAMIPANSILIFDVELIQVK